MLCKLARGAIAAAALPLLMGVGSRCEDSKQVAPAISNLSKYKDLIVLPGSANPQLAKDVAAELGIELGSMETARQFHVLSHVLTY